MQNQILGFFIITCVCVGVLCGVQWKQLREKKQEASALRHQVADQTLELDGKSTALKYFNREQARLTLELQDVTSLVRTLREATNALNRKLENLTIPGLDQGGAHIKSLGSLLDTVLQDSALLDRLMLQQYRAELDGTPHPLQEDQSAALWNVLGEEQQRLSQADDTALTNAALPLSPSNSTWQVRSQRQETFNHRVLKRAQDFLLPDQLQQLARLQTNQMQVQEFAFQLQSKIAGLNRAEGTAAAQPLRK